MRSLATLVVLLILFATLASQAQSQQSADSNTSASSSASKQEVNELRKEVAEQRKTIEELKAIVQKLADSKAVGNSPAAVQPISATISTPTPAAEGSGDTHLVNTVLTEPEVPIEAMMEQAKPT